MSVVPNGMSASEFLLAVHELQQLAYRYALAFDTRDELGLKALFAEVDDPPATYPTLNFATMQRGDTPRWFRSFGASTLFVGNHVLDVDSPTAAHGLVYCHAQLQAGDDLVEQWLCYEDRYVKTGDTWRFRDRRHLLWIGLVSAERPYAQAPMEWPRRNVGVGTLPHEFAIWAHGGPWSRGGGVDELERQTFTAHHVE
jgi:hypothetical protein